MADSALGKLKTNAWVRGAPRRSSMFIIQHFPKSARGNHCNFVAAFPISPYCCFLFTAPKTIEILDRRNHGVLFVAGMEELGLPLLTVESRPIQPPGVHFCAPIETQLILIQKGVDLQFGAHNHSLANGFPKNFTARLTC